MAARPATPVRHARAGSTGATTLARKLSEGWTIECLSHGPTTTAPNRSAAWIAGSHPQNYCATCAAIVAGKAERVTGARVEVPAEPAPTEKAARRPAVEPGPAKKPTSRKRKAALDFSAEGAMVAQARSAEKVAATPKRTRAQKATAA